jgi:hypothetical protein
MVSRYIFKNKHGICVLSKARCASNNYTDCRNCTLPLIYKEKIIGGDFNKSMQENCNKIDLNDWSFVIVMVAVIGFELIWLFM